MRRKKSFYKLIHVTLAIFVCTSIMMTGCAIDEGNVPIGTIGGALGGAAVGSLIGGGVTPVACALGGAALGGILGNQVVDAPSQRKAQDEKFQRQLDYERQSQIQHAQIQKQLHEQDLFNQWKKEHGYS